MAVSNVLSAVALISVAWGIVSSIVIANALQKRGVKVSWIFLRRMIIKYFGQYRGITRQETGRTGPRYYGCRSAIAQPDVLIRGCASRSELSIGS